MKKRIIFTTLPLLLIIALVASPVLAKDPEPPEKGLLWETLDSLQQQIEEGLSSLAQQLAEGLNALQGQINAIQDRLETLETFDEIDPTVDEMVKDGVAWNEISDIPVGFADGTDDVGAGGSLKHLVNNFIVASGHSVIAGDVVTFLDGVIQKGHFQGI